MSVNKRPEKRPSGLGKGLGQLIQRTDFERPASARPSSHIVDHVTSSPASAGPKHEVPEGSYFAEVPLGQIVPNPQQPRTVFDEDALHELTESIREVGLLQPIVVRPIANDQYEIVMGERRWRAATESGLERIPAIVRETSDHDLLRDALLENLHRAQLNPLEEAAAYAQMLEDFGCTQEELANRIKRSRPQISNTIRLLKLPPTVQRRVAAGVLSSGHARALLAVSDPLAQERLAQRVVAENLSVRSLEELVTLGETGREEASSRASTPREKPQRALDLTEELSDRFETRVRVDMGRNKGRITIEFASEEDLDRILALMKAEEQD
ncbi:ParB/RepB/Spo0J family partition protein [Propionibacteriaceae bacterium Y1685]|uniref:ParB/RepB/Spo0J family partition protein n=1 Tax=Microlunatus sp. Y1700 TaxID=3418487 RepID=UPI003B826CC1